MTHWYVNELSKLTKVTVRTLHHYDKIGLLKPSLRLENNYRVYSEGDLLKLQQIIALKFFGFELSHIKKMMEDKINIFDHFRAQQKLLELQVKSLQVASQTLEIILNDRRSNKSVPWKTIIKLIEDYQMIKELKHAWVAKILTPEELQEYAQVEQHLQTHYTKDQERAFEQKWNALVQEIETNLDKNPDGPLGIKLGQQCMDIVNEIYGKKHVSLRNSLWEKGYKQAHMQNEHGLSPEVVDWLDKAVVAYHQHRIYDVLSQVETAPSNQVLKMWKELVQEIAGDDPASQEEVYEAASQDDKVSLAAKNWLIQIRES